MNRFLKFYLRPFLNERYILLLTCSKEEAKIKLENIFAANKGFRSFTPNISGKFTGNYTFKASPKFEFAKTSSPTSMSIEIDGIITEDGDLTNITMVLQPNYVLRFMPVVAFIAITSILLFGKSNTLKEKLILGPILLIAFTLFPLLYIRFMKSQLKDVFSSIFIAHIINRTD